jgi:hypothetical protein
MLAVLIACLATLYYRVRVSESARPPGGLLHLLLGLGVGLVPIAGLVVLLLAGSTGTLVAAPMELGALLGTAFSIAAALCSAIWFALLQQYVSSLLGFSFINPIHMTKIRIETFLILSWVAVVLLLLFPVALHAFFQALTRRRRRRGLWYDWFVGALLGVVPVSPRLMTLMRTVPYNRVLGAYAMSCALVSGFPLVARIIDPDTDELFLVTGLLAGPLLFNVTLPLLRSLDTRPPRRGGGADVALGAVLGLVPYIGPILAWRSLRMACAAAAGWILNVVAVTMYVVVKVGFTAQPLLVPLLMLGVPHIWFGGTLVGALYAALSVRPGATDDAGAVTVDLNEDDDDEDAAPPKETRLAELQAQLLDKSADAAL